MENNQDWNGDKMSELEKEAWMVQEEFEKTGEGHGGKKERRNSIKGTRRGRRWRKA